MILLYGVDALEKVDGSYMRTAGSLHKEIIGILNRYNHQAGLPMIKIDGNTAGPSER